MTELEAANARAASYLKALGRTVDYLYEIYRLADSERDSFWVRYEILAKLDEYYGNEGVDD